MPAHRRSIARVIARHDPGDRTASDRAPLDPIGLDALTGDFFDLTVPTMLMSGQPFGARPPLELSSASLQLGFGASMN